jgi:hypothetical protein
MKVRWTKNSLRLRITPGELATLEQSDSVREEIRFPGAEIPGWSVVILPGGPLTSLRLQGCSARLQLSDSDRARLQAPDAEGVYFEHETFHYYIEKDFPCIHPRAGDAMEEPTETFPNPAHLADRG